MAGMSKDKLREEMRVRRRGIGSSSAAEVSKAIIARCLEKINWSSVISLHTYVAIKSVHEIDTWPLLQTIWNKYPGVTTAVPRVTVPGHFESVIATQQTTWITSNAQIPEPDEGKILPLDHKFDVIIVPLLAFDSHGFRLGSGTGAYDRFLRNQARAYKIGICYDFGLVPDGLPNEAHDIPLNCIITENKVYRS